MKKKEKGKPFKSSAIYVVASIAFFAFLALLVVYYHPAAVNRWRAERFVRKNTELLLGCAAEIDANAEGPNIAALMQTGKVRSLSAFDEGGRRSVAFFLSGKDRAGAGRAILYVPSDEAGDASKAAAAIIRAAGGPAVPSHEYWSRITENFYYFEYGPGK